MPPRPRPSPASRDRWPPGSSVATPISVRWPRARKPRSRRCSAPRPRPSWPRCRCCRRRPARSRISPSSPRTCSRNPVRHRRPPPASGGELRRMHRWTRKALCGLNRTVGRWLPPGTLSRQVPGIPGRVHVDDQMHRSDAPEHVRHYVEDALSAMENIEVSLAATGRSLADVEACLDFACGYGRVTRWLARALGPARVTAADIDRQAIRFCAHEFGVRPLAAHAETARTAFPGAYDLVFAGSLLTHLPLHACPATLHALAATVRPRGLLVFSTQGESCLAHLDWYGPEFVAAAEELRSSVQR